MLRKVDSLDARVCVFRVNAVKAEKGREGRAEDVAAACGLRHVTVFFPKKSKKKFGICDKIQNSPYSLLRLVQLRFIITKNLEKREKDRVA